MTTTTSRDVATPETADGWPAERGALRAVAATQDPPDSTLGELAVTYFARVPDTELVADPADALATVRAHRSLARLRVPGKPVTAVLDTPGAAGRISVLVVTDDMPFLIDSVLAELDRTGASVHRVVHPVIVVRRDVRGELLDILPLADPAAPPPGTVAESWMNIELGDLPGSDPARDLAADLHARLSGVLVDVREVVEDGDRMVSTARALADELAAAGGSDDTAETADTVALLRWFAQGNLIMLGYRRQEVVDTPEGPALRGVLATGLGVLRRDSLVARTLTASPDSVTPAGVAGDEGPRRLLVLTRASARSTVHRPEHPLYVGVSIHDADGRLVGEHRFLGILTVAARHADVLGIPVVSRRVQEVVAEAGLPVDSWSGQRLLEVLQTYPRAELLCTDRASLEATATGVLDLAERRRVRLFLRRDPFGRYFSCMIYLPRDRYTTATRTRMQDVLMRDLRGTDLEHTARVTEDQLALLHVTVHTGREEPVTPDLDALTRDLAEAARTWSDRLRERATGEERAVLAAIGEPFGEAYKEDFPPERGLADLRVLDGLTPAGSEGEGRDTAVRLYHPSNPDAGDRRLKLYLAGRRATLSSVLPALQSLGVVVVDERPYEVTRSDGVTCWINDFGLRLGDTETVRPGTEHDLTERFAEAFDAVWSGHVGADGFNALVLRAGLSWRQAAVLRAFSRYLRQVGSAYGQSYITDVVGAHRDVAVGLVELFEARFDPALGEDDRAHLVAEIDERVTAAIAEVTNLDADRILRALLGVVRATLRTNHFRRDAAGAPRAFLSLKLDPAQVPGVPEPVPAIETFVHSNRVEGVHLRFGPIARGGLRWSDRLQDYRTEILGLVKAQAVKNAVIVPVGAKGGFVVKRPPAPTGDAAHDREATRAEGVACYRMFISGMLDLVDDRAGHAANSAIRTPSDVVRYDGDDPYLVVAADKGTATFSDLANAVAADYGFWLGDAFASGGSVGYDHKAMAITARGAWESVRRHFRELGRDVATDEITVVGVGDMSGDVFGNGMLLSEHLKIIAAFDHRHVFLDPDPDPATSYAERRRLFGLARSSWADYDESLISAGGGVFPRTMKSIPVSPRAAEVLGVEPGDLDPPTLIRAVLRAPADLFWNGGIGTYVKASTETHADVGDKGNDAVRVDADELRVGVVGEGGNLGLTQRGRIEYARHGGKVNTDAVDNSAGVDCSDHEVNIKILLDSLVERGELDPAERDQQIAATTEDVAALVLADNVSQNEVLGVSRAHATGMLHVHRDLVADLAARGRLDRELDVLPDEEGFAARAADDEGLSSPELCTLLAHVKLDLTDALAASELPDLEVFARRLPAYFPPVLAESYPDAVAAHPLRRQIVTTMLANRVVDGGGLTFVHRLVQEVAASPADAVRAYHVATAVFGLDELADDLAAADQVLPTYVSDRITLAARRQLDRAARWFLTKRPQPLAVGAEIARFGPWLAKLAPQVPDLLRGGEADGLFRRTQDFVIAGAPVDLARRAIGGLYGFGLLDVVEIAEIAEREQGGVHVHDGEVTDDEVLAVAELYYALSEHLGLDALLTAVAGLDRTDRWYALARLSLRDELYASLRAITLDVLADTGPEESVDEKIEHWEQANASRLIRARTALAEIAQERRDDLATVSVAARQLRSMVR
ncbi:NAD-glutamate dehydrogenase [Actinomycetospora cinnamomea]|uniref:Glutamate dehydrogenase n=1 Tax=Actinomycetospora cinnamomea TaxID=663609 RepID=A0A2U1EYB2_9PSEU|nr:NAD-glutamate dehydrogenase [Actinomycetospora cinnamomea]PVZ04901.1 glutamate dehydrogenase [Actinomycetospora cinnamomea]